MGSSPWLGLALGVLAAVWSGRALYRRTGQRRLALLFLALGILSILLSLHELLP